MKTKAVFESKINLIGFFQALIGCSELALSFISEGDMSPLGWYNLIQGGCLIIIRTFFTDTKIR